MNKNKETITCLKCNNTSHNSDDVKYIFCIKCGYHDRNKADTFKINNTNKDKKMTDNNEAIEILREAGIPDELIEAAKRAGIDLSKIKPGEQELSQSKIYVEGKIQDILKEANLLELDPLKVSTDFIFYMTTVCATILLRNLRHGESLISIESAFEGLIAAIDTIGKDIINDPKMQKHIMTCKGHPERTKEDA